MTRTQRIQTFLGLQISRPLPKRPHKTHSSGFPKGTDSRIPKDRRPMYPDECLDLT